MPAAEERVVLPFPVALDVVGAVAGGDHLLVGDGGHKGAEGKADLAGIRLTGGPVTFDHHLHRHRPYTTR